MAWYTDRYKHSTFWSSAPDAVVWTVSDAGDFNGDGIDDFMVGAPGATANGYRGTGVVYVVFGQNGDFPSDLDLSTLDGSDGFTLNGPAPRPEEYSGYTANDFSRGTGYYLSSAGDVNDDGFNDLAIATKPGGPASSNESETYVVFGNAGDFGASVELSALDSSNGYVVARTTEFDKLARDANAYGISAGDLGFKDLGPWEQTWRYTGAGDVNGDGFADIVVGLWGDFTAGQYSGAAYVVFGKAGGFDSGIDLRALDGTDGFAIRATGAWARLGANIDGAGDFNGDGYDDVVVSAAGQPNQPVANQTFVIFGSGDGFSATVDTANLKAGEGVALQGDGGFGRDVSFAGDVNNDGFDDVLVSNGVDGEVQLFYGGNYDEDETLIGGQGSDIIDGNAGNDLIDGQGGHDWLYGGYGDDTLIGGTGINQLFGGNGNDLLVGGNDFDHLRGEEGNDRIIGSAGYDIAYFSGSRVDYTIIVGGKANAIVTDNNLADGDEGSDFLTGVEVLRFLGDRAANSITIANLTGGDGVHHSVPTISDNGQFVFFGGSNAGFGQAMYDGYVKNLATGSIARASTLPSGWFIAQGDVSDDGNFAVFTGSRSNSDPAFPFTRQDVFHKNFLTGEVTLVSQNLGAGYGNDVSNGAEISADGRYVTFYSKASDLVSGDTPGTGDFFKRDMVTGELTKLVNPPEGTAGIVYTDISADGGFVAFAAQYRTSEGAAPSPGIYVHVTDLATGETRLIGTDIGESVPISGKEPVISGDGRFVVFEATGSQLYLQDMATGELKVLANIEGGTSELYGISDDGQFIVFKSQAMDLIPGEILPKIGAWAENYLFVMDTQTGEVALLDRDAAGVPMHFDGDDMSISGDGRLITFWADSSKVSGSGDRIKNDIYLVNNPLIAGSSDFIVPGAGGSDPVLNPAGGAPLDQGTILIGDGRGDDLTGGGGDDALLGGDGNDKLLGGGGNDVLIGGGSEVSEVAGGAVFTAVVGDFDGDGKLDDVVWRRASDGQLYMWQVEDSDKQGEDAVSGSLDTNWQILGVGDFDGDGKHDDILWQRITDGQTYMWQMEAGVVVSTSVVQVTTNLSWQVIGIGDFDGDGKDDDVLWYRNSDGRIYIREMEDGSVVQGFLVKDSTDLAWELADIGDFDGDGKVDDVLWYRNTDGRVYIRDMEDQTIVKGYLVKESTDLSWEIAGVGDFDGDGKDDDILWYRNSDGRTYIRETEDHQITNGSLVASSFDTAWEIAEIGDFDGDGQRNDILWRNTTDGTVDIWNIENSRLAASDTIVNTDVLTGGTGDDLFVFGDGDGDNVITDFTPGAGTDDKLDISAFNFADLNAVTAASTDDGFATTIALDADDSVTLLGVQLSDLHQDDFIL